MLRQPRVFAGGVQRKPFGQGFGHAGDEFGVALFAALHHGLHGFQNGGVLFGVAIVRAEAGGQHPALFLREMFDCVVDKGAVQRQLLIRRGGQKLVEQAHEFFVGIVHTGVAQEQRGGPVQRSGGEGGL